MRNNGEFPDEPLALLSAQALRVQDASLALADELILFGIGVQLAWFDAWARPFLQASAEMKSWQEGQARAARLMRRGIPGPLAREGLHLLPN